MSAGLLYRYFPSKQAVVLALYDELSAEYQARAETMAPGNWRDRFLYTLERSLEVQAPHRGTLAELVPVLVGTANEGVFAPGTAFSRQRVHAVFGRAVLEAADAPPPEVGAALGRLLYLLHLAITLWWLLDKSPGQRATNQLVALTRRALPLFAFTVRIRAVRSLIVRADVLFREALFDDVSSGRPEG